VTSTLKLTNEQKRLGRLIREALETLDFQGLIETHDVFFGDSGNGRWHASAITLALLPLMGKVDAMKLFFNEHLQEDWVMVVAAELGVEYSLLAGIDRAHRVQRRTAAEIANELSAAVFEM